MGLKCDPSDIGPFENTIRYTDRPFSSGRTPGRPSDSENFCPQPSFGCQTGGNEWEILRLRWSHERVEKTLYYLHGSLHEDNSSRVDRTWMRFVSTMHKDILLCRLVYEKVHLHFSCFGTGPTNAWIAPIRGFGPSKSQKLFLFRLSVWISTLKKWKKAKFKENLSIDKQVSILISRMNLVIVKITQIHYWFIKSILAYSAFLLPIQTQTHLQKR